MLTCSSPPASRATTMSMVSGSNGRLASIGPPFRPRGDGEGDRGPALVPVLDPPLAQLQLVEQPRLVAQGDGAQGQGDDGLQQRAVRKQLAPFHPGEASVRVGLYAARVLGYT